VTISLKAPDGKMITIQSTKASKSGTLITPALQYKKSGTYTLFIKVGKTTKTVTVKVAK
jgi:hypothetical protein